MATTTPTVYCPPPNYPPSWEPGIQPVSGWILTFALVTSMSGVATTVFALAVVVSVRAQTSPDPRVPTPPRTWGERATTAPAPEAPSEPGLRDAPRAAAPARRAPEALARANERCSQWRTAHCVVRSGPSQSAAPFAECRVHTGEVVTVLDASGRWWRVAACGRVGYMHRDVLLP